MATGGYFYFHRPLMAWAQILLKVVLLDYQFNLNGWESTDDSLVQPMKFDHYRFHQTISWQVTKIMFTLDLDIILTS